MVVWFLCVCFCSFVFRKWCKSRHFVFCAGKSTLLQGVWADYLLHFHRNTMFQDKFSGISGNILNCQYQSLGLVFEFTVFYWFNSRLEKWNFCDMVIFPFPLVIIVTYLFWCACGFWPSASLAPWCLRKINYPCSIERKQSNTQNERAKA